MTDPELTADVRQAIIDLSRCLLPVHMGMAQAELVGEPMTDSTVVLHFMGSGASDQVTAGEVRKALADANAVLRRLEL